MAPLCPISDRHQPNRLVTTSSPDGIFDRIRLHCDGFFAFGSLPPAALPPFAARRTATGSLDGSGAALGCCERGERRAREHAELEQTVAAPWRRGLHLRPPSSREKVWLAAGKYKYGDSGTRYEILVVSYRL